MVAEGALRGSHADSEPWTLASIQAPDPTPQTYAEFQEQCRVLFASLETEQLRTVAQLKLEGYSNEEIADRLGVVSRTVERKLKLIRDQWSEKRP